MQHVSRRLFPILTLAALVNAPSAASEPLRVGIADFPALPPGWTMSREGDVLRFSPAGQKLSIFAVPVIKAEPRAAITALASRAKDCPFPIKSQSVGVPDFGFDAVTNFDFDTPPSSGKTMFGGVLAKNQDAVALLLCSDNAPFDKYQADWSGLIRGIHRTGWVDEDWSGKTPAHWTPDRIAAMRQFVEDGMKRLAIPGVAIALIDNGRIVHEEGFGIRQLGRPEKVDAHTRFGIASNTKGMTTLLLARLVGEGRLRWDQPVREVMPQLRLADPAMSDKLLVRHLICACTGLPRADFEGYFVDPHASSQLVIDELARLKPTSGFGERYQYSNTLAAAAGILAGHVAFPEMEPLAAYNRAMKEMVFAPLGMTETDFGDPRTQRGNFAEAHSTDPVAGQFLAPQGVNATLLPYRSTGGALSSVHDVALFVANELNEGRLANGKQWVDRAALLARRQKGVKFGATGYYGMGLMIRIAGKRDVLSHGGDMNGYHSQWMALPGTGMGAAILTNNDAGKPLVSRFNRRALELLFGGEPLAAKLLEVDAAAQDQEVADRRAHLHPVGELGDTLAPAYANPVLGNIRVIRAKEGVTFDFGAWQTPVLALDDAVAPGGKSLFAAHDEIDSTMIFVPGKEADGTPTLTLSDAQHHYVYRAVR